MKVWCYHCSKSFHIDKEGDYPCPYCNKSYADLSDESKRAVKAIFRQFRFTTKQVVLWKEGDTIIIWDPTRTPALGWNNLTLLEAKADSAKVHLGMGNINKAQENLNHILTILRSAIEREKEKHDLLNRCEYRETKRTRCNKTPVIAYQGKYYCPYHLELVKEYGQSTLLEFMEVKKEFERDIAFYEGEINHV